jgi:2-amino-4-hydroxy-6-hydroxymethyldihydropteridine diphosphokinase
MIALGSNQNQPIVQINNAIVHLKRQEGIKVLARSSLWLTLPLDQREQPCFVNTVVAIRVAWPNPYELLYRTQAIERRQGRVPDKNHAYDDRPIDIDILYFSHCKRQDQQLTLPHSALFKRDFFIHLFHELDNAFLFNDGSSIQDKKDACPRIHLITPLLSKANFE